MVTVFFAAATLTMPVCIDRSRPPKREGETKEERSTLILKVKTKMWVKLAHIVPIRAKRRRSRWTEEGSKTYIPGMPTMIPEGLTPQQEKVWNRDSNIFSNLAIPGVLATVEDWRGQLEIAQRRPWYPSKSRGQVSELRKSFLLRQFFSSWPWGNRSHLDHFRSPSPEPIYDGMGKRQNTRDVR